MSLDPLLSAPLHIQIHAAAALIAVAVGPLPLYRKKRDRLHKITGYIWVAAMFTVAASAFFIHSFAVIGPFSPLHGFALLTFWSLFTGMRHIFAGRVRAHRATFRALYWFGLMGAGVANFLPDRLINEAVFGGSDNLGWIVIGLATVLLIWIARGGRGAADLALAPQS
ncbi:DUF2306 domain-containing protein [Octadecabacter sp. 1_MG-2023]|uniref:DUF2306 domain-containing protein n=1 Tax=unclassified Octadecabacter TaxID=196158 RepID=UPI001C08A5FA|nr:MULTISPECIES: DUF2306 domain-containing protein [unclassified Octadecabacter]MBU2993872.1 DUF2306 domain-containing protein [Octadecabacter sp. B2R22]MDO6735282.1 DUF2306 domain-containing protein [Octadecabacter sp. 1_MG-2023]